LAICKKIVENHNGIIHAPGMPGKGTTIHIYLPPDDIKHQNELFVKQKQAIQL
jgi:signal transduction histidine kinase